MLLADNMYSRTYRSLHDPQNRISKHGRPLCRIVFQPAMLATSCCTICSSLSEHIIARFQSLWAHPISTLTPYSWPSPGGSARRTPHRRSSGSRDTPSPGLDSVWPNSSAHWEWCRMRAAAPRWCCATRTACARQTFCGCQSSWPLPPPDWRRQLTAASMRSSSAARCFDPLWRGNGTRICGVWKLSVCYRITKHAIYCFAFFISVKAVGMHCAFPYSAHTHTYAYTYCNAYTTVTIPESRSLCNHIILLSLLQSCAVRAHTYTHTYVQCAFYRVHHRVASARVSAHCTDRISPMRVTACTIAHDQIHTTRTVRPHVSVVGVMWKLVRTGDQNIQQNASGWGPYSVWIFGSIYLNYIE